jgi:hypothetical protein
LPATAPFGATDAPWATSPTTASTDRLTRCHRPNCWSKFVPAEGVVYRLPEDSEGKSLRLEFYRELFEPKGPTKSPISGMEVVAQSRRDVVEGGRAWAETEMTLRVVAGDREQRMRLRVDP